MTRSKNCIAPIANHGLSSRIVHLSSGVPRVSRRALNPGYALNYMALNEGIDATIAKFPTLFPGMGLTNASDTLLTSLLAFDKV